MLIGYVNQYPAVHYFGIPRLTQSMIAYNTLTSISGNSSEKLHCGNVVHYVLEICELGLAFEHE